jgi:hypothetical protein
MRSFKKVRELAGSDKNLDALWKNGTVTFYVRDTDNPTVDASLTKPRLLPNDIAWRYILDPDRETISTDGQGVSGIVLGPTKVLLIVGAEIDEDGVREAAALKWFLAETQRPKRMTRDDYAEEAKRQFKLAPDRFRKNVWPKAPEAWKHPGRVAE